MAIERINFLKSHALGITYRHISRGVSGIVAFCALLFAYQFGMTKYYDHRIEFMKSEIERIKTGQKSLLVKVPKRASLSVQETVADEMRKSASWPVFLFELSKVLPKGIWVSKISSINSSDSNELSSFLIQGQSFKAETIPKFINRLKNLPIVMRISNPKTNKGDSNLSSLMAYSFEITLKQEEKEQ